MWPPPWLPTSLLEACACVSAPVEKVRNNACAGLHAGSHHPAAALAPAGQDAMHANRSGSLNWDYKGCTEGEVFKARAPLREE